MICLMVVATVSMLCSTTQAAYLCNAGGTNENDAWDDSCKHDSSKSTGYFKCLVSRHIGSRPPRAPLDGT